MPKLTSAEQLLKDVEQLYWTTSNILYGHKSSFGLSVLQIPESRFQAKYIEIACKTSGNHLLIEDFSRLSIENLK